jgi:hypothetical protein
MDTIRQIGDTSHWADLVIGVIEHRTAKEDFVRGIRPFVIE